MQPPASLKALSDPIYEVFYGLTEQPFAITTDPRFFYLSASHQRAFTELLNGLRRRESLLMLTGDTGTGKTTMCRAVIDALGDRTFSAIILNPYMTGAEVLRIVLRDFGLVSHEELRRGGLATADIPQLIDTLEGFLRGLVPLGSHAVLVLDEAQSLAPTVLDQVRMLTGLEYQGHKLLQVVLCGQPGLQPMIQADNLLALNERITRRVELRALPPEDIPGYIQHRLGVAGGANSVRFDAAAMQAVADLSRGLPRRINVLCDRALQEGRIEGVNVITAALVKRAARAVAGVHDPLPVTNDARRPAAPASSAAPSAAGRSDGPPAAPSPAVSSPAVPAPAAQSEVTTPAADQARQPATAPPPPTSTPPAAPPAAGAARLPDGVPSKTASSPAPPADPAPLPRPGPVQVRPAGATPGVQPPAPAATAPPPVTAPKTDPHHPVFPTEATPQASPAPSPPAPPATDATSAWPPVAADTADEPAAPVFSRELTFGLEEPRDTHRGRTLTIAAAVLLIVGTAGYASWSWDVREPSSLVGPPPAGPVVEQRLFTLPVVPSAEEVARMFQPGFFNPDAVTPRAPVETPAPAAAAPPVAPARPGAPADPFSAPTAGEPASGSTP